MLRVVIEWLGNDRIHSVIDNPSQTISAYGIPMALIIDTHFRMRYLQAVSFLCLNLVFATAIFAANPTYNEIEWTQLIPEDDLQALLNPPDFMLNIQDGSAEDNLETLAEKTGNDEQAKRFNEALKSERINPDFEGQAVRIPGFVVPLKTNEERQVISFFVVPYFGACLHLPPPPPNQMLYGEWREGLTVDELSTPLWFEGKLQIETQSNELGTAAYRINVENIEIYQ